MILPGATLGMLGGGQLGMFFTIAARRMGYDVIIYDPDNQNPAASFASKYICAQYDDEKMLDQFASECQAISIEFENIPSTTVAYLSSRCIVHPNAEAVAITQNRIREKTFLRDAGIPTTRFAVIHSLEELEENLKSIGVPAALKVARGGYDGKGQFVIQQPDQAESAWNYLNNEACILEAYLPLELEISIVIARDTLGNTSCFPVSENIHHKGILDISLAPARVNHELANKAQTLAIEIADQLNYVGVMAVEYFISGGELLVNEIAPRPHNSGHYTLDACTVSQFEQQVHAVCELPLRDIQFISPIVMVNLLGDLWNNNLPPQWDMITSHQNTKLHLYGKKHARPGRKMGHFTAMSATVERAYDTCHQIRQRLGIET